MSRLSELERKRDLTRAALNEKLNALEDRVRTSIDDARETVKRAVDLQYQVEKRPLIILGCSALMGYFLGRVWFTGSGSGESEAENGAGRHENKTSRADSAPAQTGLLKSALTAAVSNLLVGLIKEMMPVGRDEVENVARSEPQLPPEATEGTREGNLTRAGV